MRINENSTLKEVLRIKGAKEILRKYHFPCLKCPFASLEAENLTLKEIARFYGIELKSLVEDLNNLIKGQKLKSQNK